MIIVLHIWNNPSRFVNISDSAKNFLPLYCYLKNDFLLCVIYLFWSSFGFILVKTWHAKQGLSVMECNHDDGFHLI